jgi:hypothetical protein
MLLWIVPHLLWAFHGTVISYRDVLTVVSRPLLSGLAGALAGIVFIFFAAGSLSPFFRLLLGCTVLFSVYAWILLVVMAQKPFYMDILRGMTRSSGRVLAST